MPSDHQIVAITMAAIANCSSVSQLIGVPPKLSVMLAINPCRGENMICQISVTTVTDSTWLRKNSVRKAPIALVSRLSAAASRSAKIVTPGTARPTKSSVLPTVGQKRRSYQRPSSPGWNPGRTTKSSDATARAMALKRLNRSIRRRKIESTRPMAPSVCQKGAAKGLHSILRPHMTRS